MGERLIIPPYTGWRPRSMRAGRNKHESVREGKRDRMGSPSDKALYCSPGGPWKDKAGYRRLCERADRLNKGA